MAYTSVEQRNSSGTGIKEQSIGGYVPVSSRQAATPPPVSSTPNVSTPPTVTPADVGGYIPVEKRTNIPPVTPPAVTPPAPVAPVKPSIFTRAGNAIANAIDRPDQSTLGTDAGKNTLKYLPSSIVESLPFGLGQAFTQIHDMEQNAPGDVNNPAQFIDNKDLVKNLPGAVLDTAKGFVKAPISGALDVAGLTGKKIKFDIPGLGEVSNAQYRVAQRVSNGENPVQVALEEGSGAILDTLFFASLVSKPFLGRPTVTAKSEIPASDFAKVPDASKSLQPKSFRLYEPRTSAQPLTPEFIDKAKSQGVDFGPNFKPERPTYFRMSYDPKGDVFKGEIVQIKPAWVSVIAKKFSGDISQAPKQALDVIAAPKEVTGKAIEAGVKNPIIETKTPTAPAPEVKAPLTPQEKTDVLLGNKKPIDNAPVAQDGAPEPTADTFPVGSQLDVYSKKLGIIKNTGKVISTDNKGVVMIEPTSGLPMRYNFNQFDFKSKNAPETTPTPVQNKNQTFEEVSKLYDDYVKNQVAAKKDFLGWEEWKKENGITQQFPQEKTSSISNPEISIPDISPAMEQKANKDWEDNYAEEYGTLSDQVSELQKKLKEVGKAEQPVIQGQINFRNEKMAKMESEFVSKWQKKSSAPTEKPAKETKVQKEERIKKETLTKTIEGFSPSENTIIEKYRGLFKRMFELDRKISEKNPQLFVADAQERALKALAKEINLTDAQQNFLIDKIAYMGPGYSEDSYHFKEYVVTRELLSELKKLEKTTPKEASTTQKPSEQIPLSKKLPKNEKVVSTNLQIGDMVQVENKVGDKMVEDVGSVVKIDNNKITIKNPDKELSYSLDEFNFKKVGKTIDNQIPKTPSGNAMAIYKDENTPGIPIKAGKLINDINPIEFPELVDLARELMGKVPEVVKKTGDAAGRFIGKVGSPQDTRIKLITELFTQDNPNQLAVTLAHELGHLIDFLPNGTLARGNLLGRLQTLRKFMRNIFGEGESVTNKEIRAELMKVTQELHPYDPETVPASYKRYRESGKELYAEAVSMLFNSPGHLQDIAPKFWKEFFDGLDKKPEVFNAYFELQDLLGGDRNTLLERRRAGVRGMFDAGDMKAQDIQRARMAIKEEERKNFIFNFKFNLVDKNYALIDRVNTLKKQGKFVSDDENPVYYLEERNYLGGKIKSFMETNIQPIFAKLQENQISWNDFGEALFYDRIRNGDRADVANPRGITPEAAKELLAKVFTDMGKEKADILATAMEDFRGALKTVTDEAFKEGLIKPEMFKQMMENPAYATFQVLDHMEEGMTSKIHKSIGTLKDVANPADASLLKTISTIRAIERNKVTRSVVEFLQKEFPEDIKEADVIRTPKGAVPKESRLPGEELITYMKDGKVSGYYVDKFIQRSVDNETIGHTISILRTMNSALFRPLFITYNPGFQAFNFIRDFKRFWKNTPDMTFIKAMSLYKQAVPVAKARAFGFEGKDLGNGSTLFDQNVLIGARLLAKMEKDQILSISYNQLADGADVEDKQIETILRSSGIDSFQPEVKYKALQPFVKVLDFIKDMGDFVETLPKVAGYLEFSKGGVEEISREQKSFIRKNIGSPDFLAGGYWKPLTNEVFLFSNAITQGIRSDVQVATEPKTRSGYWYKTAKMNVLPKILMFLASLGVFGASMKKHMDDASEYDKTQYTIIPLGSDSKGKSVYFRDPQDEAGRLIGGLAWKIINSSHNKQSIGKDLVDIASFAGGQLPSVAPSITSAVATGQFINGQNPYDWFRNREVLTDDQMKAGGLYAAKPFLGWLLNQSGGGVFYQFTQGAPREKSSTEKLFNLPVVGNIAGRFVKVSDYGTTETLKQITDKVASEESRARIDESTIINKYIEKAHGAKDQATVDAQVAKNKANLITDVLGHAPQTSEELTKAKNILKKYQVGLQRGESDPYINALIGATTSDQQIELVKEYRKTLSKQDFNQIFLTSIKYKIVSPETFIKAVKSAKNEQ